MQYDIRKTRLDIQYVTDRYGNRVFVQIPVGQWKIILTQLPDIEGMEPDEPEAAEVVDRQGILVVRSRMSRDITNVVREERERRLLGLIGRIKE